MMKTRIGTSNPFGFIRRCYYSSKTYKLLDIPYPTDPNLSVRQLIMRSVMGAARNGEPVRGIKDVSITKQQLEQWNYKLTSGDLEEGELTKHQYNNYTLDLREKRLFSKKTWRSLLNNNEYENENENENRDSFKTDRLQKIITYFNSSSNLQPFNIKLQERLELYHKTLPLSLLLPEGYSIDEAVSQDKLKKFVYDHIINENITNTKTKLIERRHLLTDSRCKELARERLRITNISYTEPINLTIENLIPLFSELDESNPICINDIEVNSLEKILNYIDINDIDGNLNPELINAFNNLYQTMVTQEIPLTTNDIYRWILITPPKDRYIRLIHLIEKRLEVGSQDLNLVLSSSFGILNSYDILSYIDACQIEPDRYTFCLMIQYATSLGDINLFSGLVEMMIEDFEFAIDVETAKLLVESFTVFGYPKAAGYIAKNIVSSSASDSEEYKIGFPELLIYDFLREQNKSAKALQFKLPLSKEDMGFFAGHSEF